MTAHDDEELLDALRPPCHSGGIENVNIRSASIRA